MSSEMLTSEELAARWSMAEATLRNWRVSGNGPRFIRLGGLIRYLISDVVAFENKQASCVIEAPKQKPKKKKKKSVSR